MPSPNLDVRAATALLAGLCQLEREVVALTLAEQAGALERAREAGRRLGEIGSPDGVLDRAAEELGRNSRFETVLVSQVDDRALIPRAVWAGGDPEAGHALLAALHEQPPPLDYPLVEAEVARGKRAQVVPVDASGSRTPPALRELLGGPRYLIAPLVLRGRTIGLLHASGETLDATALAIATAYAHAVARAFERATLRSTLERHREELRVAVGWMNSRIAGREPERPSGRQSDADDLTSRELEVLRLVSSGQTNGDVARELLISESTAKFHVKNILRKLQATNRADAVAKYMRGRV